MKRALILAFLITSCQLEAGNCGDLLDNDRDGAVDCQDDDCAAEPLCSTICGDGVVQPPETCDDGNLTNGDGCSIDCVIEVCGDNIINNTIGGIATEECDQVNENETLNLSCTSGVITSVDFASFGDSPGSCANLVLGACDAVNSQTIVEGICLGQASCSVPVNNFVFVDDPCGGISKNLLVSVTCTSDIISEECDDGNNVDGDGCTADCQGLEVCGDGNLDTARGEQCDDGNTADGDGCDASCVIEVCGDNIINNTIGGIATEECDQVNENETLNLSCTSGVITSVDFASFGDNPGSCANPVLGACDAVNSQTIVEGICLGQASCSVPATNVVFGDPCGGISKSLLVSVTCTSDTTSEACDDGNNVDGDGCTADCLCGSDDPAVVLSLFDAGSGHCYFLVDVGLDYNAAESDCISRGGHLASITDTNENTLVAQVANQNVCWIGANDQASENTFVWTDGTTFAFDNFANGEPDDFNGVEDCVEMVNGEWNDDSCGEAKRFICELD